MPYAMSDLEQLSGLKARTIREYIRIGLVSPPKGHGLAAEYSEEQLLRVVAIARLRAQGEGWHAITDAMDCWSLAKLRAYVRKTNPPAPAPAPTAAPPSPSPSPPGPDGPPPLDGAPAPRNLPPQAAAFDESTELEVAMRIDEDLPGASRFLMQQVLPGLAILVRQDAAPLVKRIAAEILARYGVAS